MNGRGPERTAVESAQAGARAWRQVVHTQQSAVPDHGDFYGLAGEMVDTLRALESLADLLDRQVAGYGQNRLLRDDEGLDPALRITQASDLACRVRELLGGAERAANQFWSAVGHIAVEVP
jgi:hypothetical protein